MTGVKFVACKKGVWSTEKPVCCMFGSEDRNHLIPCRYFTVELLFSVTDIGSRLLSRALATCSSQPIIKRLFTELFEEFESWSNKAENDGQVCFRNC